MDFTKEYLEQIIADQIEESSQIEYKAADALGKSDGKKSEITKDISALANSAGGILIYGIREHSNSDLKHLPEKLDPVDQSQYSKEWLDQITASIQPRIDGLRIIPIRVGPNTSDYCYVVDVPQSGTAHQARDHRYYRRRNFEATAMEDYEIRDVMNRRKHPVLDAAILIAPPSMYGDPSNISIRVSNTSRILARYYLIVVRMPFRLTNGLIINPNDSTIDYKEGCLLFSVSNGSGSPLFPGSTRFHPNEYKIASKIIPEPEHSIADIRISVYADEMERLDLTKNLAVAEAGWT